MACARRSEGRGKVQMELNIEDYAPEVRTFFIARFGVVWDDARAY